MKKFMVLLLVLACLFGLGTAMRTFTVEPTLADGPVYPPPIIPPFPPPDCNSIVVVADGPVYPPPIIPPFPPPVNNTVSG
ncbi:MAG: hypothetical protein GX863_06640 [Firmicutes bacterium]|nr:hypothetical protein [Candidatus Fermentithermobacillaceae bacterium]